MIDKLLLIDDDEIANFLVNKLVKKSQTVNQLIIQENGHDALTYLQSVNNTKQFPNIIIVDLDMPVMNGYEFLEVYEREFWPKYPDTKVFMVTSSRRKLDKEMAMKYKCLVDCNFKPINIEYLQELQGSIAC